MTPTQLHMDFSSYPITGGEMFGWYDDTKGREVAEKIRGGSEAYKNKYGYWPTFVLCSMGDIGPLSLVCEGPRCINVRAAGHIRPNTFQFGREG
jgi:hypothetical protein